MLEFKMISLLRHFSRRREFCLQWRIQNIHANRVLSVHRERNSVLLFFTESVVRFREEIEVT